MPRGVKRTIAYQIAEVDAKIEKKQQDIKKLQAYRKELDSTYQAEVAAKIIQAANDKGISVDAVLDSIHAQ